MHQNIEITSDAQVCNPRGRVPVSFIIDDSTCLVNLNRYAAPQFATALGPHDYHATVPWRDWPPEIPDSFVRRFGEWCAEHGVKGKYSVVPFPACVGRLDRELPGWTRREVDDSIELVRSLIAPNFDIHPEMVTHTRIIDLKTGHPRPEYNADYMENWGWTTGRSADEIAAYMVYGLQILKNIGLDCQGITTPGGFGNQARPQLAQASYEAVRAVYGAKIPHYFRDIHTEGVTSVAPIVQNIGTQADPRIVVHVQGCTGDWTGGWDNTPPEGADKFITADLRSGRLVEVIERGEPAFLLAHWTGIYFNGEELGLRLFQEVVRRLHARFDNLLWMTLSEAARYWAAKECTQITRSGAVLQFAAPFACPDFTLRVAPSAGTPHYQNVPLREVNNPRLLTSGTWCRDGASLIACFDLLPGSSQLSFGL